MSDLIILENAEEILYSEWLVDLINQANGKGNQKNRRNFLKKVFETSWEEIKRKTRTEGSVWYVWWMDGVHNFALYHKTGKFRKEYSL